MPKLPDNVRPILFGTFTVVALLVSAAALSDSKSKKELRAERARLHQIYTRRPRRTDTPLRIENISDDETRELQAVTRKHFPGAIANISGVIAGCPCEEGPECDSQVWILAHRQNRYDGLMLSRIENKWTVGPIQQWWLEYDRLRIRMREVMFSKEPGSRERLQELRTLQYELQEAYPVCLDQGVD